MNYITIVDIFPINTIPLNIFKLFNNKFNQQNKEYCSIFKFKYAQDEKKEPNYVIIIDKRNNIDFEIDNWILVHYNSIDFIIK